MDTFRSKQEREHDLDSGFAYQADDTSTSTQHRVPTSFGFGLLRALGFSGQPAAADAPETTELDKGAQFSGFLPAKVAPATTAVRPYVDATPVYRGEYSNLSPLYFNTEPVDNANDTRLDRSRLTSYTRAQLFFLLRLERFLRLRMHWQKASPRSDEKWKTDLVLRGVYSALQDCIKHGVGDDGKALLKKWDCC